MITMVCRKTCLVRRKCFGASLIAVDAVKPDIIFGSETWLKPDKGQSEIFPPGFDVYRKDRNDGYGGVLLAVNSSLVNH